MKKKMKFVAAFVLMGLSLSVVTPKVAEAGYYNVLPGFFATDSELEADGSECSAYSTNYECVGDDSQRVQVYSVIYYQDRTTGTRGSGTTDAYDEASGEGASASIRKSAPTYYHEIYLITSIHNGYYKGQRITENTRASR